MVPTHTHVKDVYISTSQPSVLSALKSKQLDQSQIAETICIDQSTIRMDVSQEVGKTLEAAGAKWIDAPVSGGVNGAENASLTIMCGASSPETFEKARPILGMMGVKVVQCGGMGMGLAAKLCNK